MFSANTNDTNDSNNTWSPLDCLPAAALTESGLVTMEPNEVQVLTRSNVELRSAMTEPLTPLSRDGSGVASTAGKTWVDRNTDLQVLVTTHRIVLLSQADHNNKKMRAHYVHLSHLLECSAETLLFKSPKILLNTYSGDLLLVFHGDGSSITSNSAKKDRDDCLAHIHKSLQRQEWEAQARQKEQEKLYKTVTKRKVGVDAILTQSKFRHQQATKLTDTAFTGDAETLLKEATELIQIIHKYVATLDRQHEGSRNDEDAGQLADLLSNMGLTSALDKSEFRSSGMAAYYEQLARQVADFVRPKLKSSYMMTLTDVYCLYNRARASNLISPEDLLQAVQRMDDLNLGMSIRTFASGLVVLQDNAVDDEKSAARLIEFAQHPGGLTADQAAHHLQLSTVLAHEQLLVAEQLGVLVRDETLESLRFYPNRFEEFSTQW